MSKKRSIPQVPNANDMARRSFDVAVKESLDVLSGRLPNTRITALESTATLDDVIAKVNEILALLQD